MISEQKTVYVEIALYLINLHTVDLKAGTFHADFYLYFKGTCIQCILNDNIITSATGHTSTVSVMHYLYCSVLLQSWSKAMAHLAFFDNFTIPSPPPPPPPPYNVGSVHSKCPPWNNIVWGGGPSLGKRAAFIIEQRAIMKTANSQGVPYTFDQDCRFRVSEQYQVKLVYHLCIDEGNGQRERDNSWSFEC